MGISYAVVTKVKEFTETRQYGEALDLLEGEDIFQSLNPQFLRSCGEVYLENDRYYESREALVRAHVMAPEGNRIIYDLVRLYLRMGYFQRAKRYYELYVCNAAEDDVGKLYLQYMMQKANRVDARELLGILEKACEEQYSDEWGFELALLYASLGMQEKMKDECIHLMAAFRNSPYCALADDLKKGQYDVSNSNFRFPVMEVEEDLETYASIIPIEEKQWEKDELKVHPPAPVILQMEDDDGTEESSAERKDTSRGIKRPFGKRREKTEVAQQGKESLESTQADVTETGEKTLVKESELNSHMQGSEMAITSEGSKGNTTDEPVQPDLTAQGSEDVSAYIEAVMKSVADIEASAVEEMRNPITFDHVSGASIHQEETAGDSGGQSLEEKPYQSKLSNVEESLSPKERLEQLMKLIEEERQNENQQNDPLPQEEEELDLDEFLMNLVGANTITQAMVKSYREENESK